MKICYSYNILSFKELFIAATVTNHERKAETSRKGFRHNQVLYCLASELSKFVAGQCMVSVYAASSLIDCDDNGQFMNNYNLL